MENDSPHHIVYRNGNPWRGRGSHNVITMSADKQIQYICAVTLIVTSIAMAAYQVVTMSDVANGTLMYIAQAFLLAGSIFGLNYYVFKLSKRFSEESNPKT